MNKPIYSLLAFAAVCCISMCYGQKRTMTFEDFDSWNKITQQLISNDAKFVALEITPWRGDGSVKIIDNSGKELSTLSPADSPRFSQDSRFVIMSLKPKLSEVETLKLRKTKKDKMPMNRIAIYDLNARKLNIIDSIAQFRTSDKSNWLSFQKKTKDSLFVVSYEQGQKYAFANVDQYLFAKEAEMLMFVSKNGKNLSINIVDLKNGNISNIYDGEKQIKQLSSDEAMNNIAFLASESNDKLGNNYSLYVSSNRAKSTEISTKSMTHSTPNWIISQYGRVYFSKNSKKLFFATSPAIREKDSTILAENRPNVHIWNWDESKQYTQQDVDKDKDMKKSYLAVYDIASGKSTQLATPQMQDVRIINDGDCPFALASSNNDYAIESMWEGRSRNDQYIMDITSRELTPVKIGSWSRISVSPQAKYLSWYNAQDSTWYSYSIADKKEYRLASPNGFIAYDDTNDVPDYPSAQGLAGWTANDEAILLNDKYDVWSFSPKADREPINVTKNGKELGLTYRIVTLDPDSKTVSTKETSTLKGFNHKTKGNGYYSVVLDGKNAPKELIAGEFNASNIKKAKNGEKIIFTKENFEIFPDVLISNIDFKNQIKISDVNPQQRDINWGKAELVSWMNLDGKMLEGVVYYPENFDPNKKYPMVVTFYERNSETLLSHRIPEPHRSTVDYHFYTSNGYIVFNPDIIYTTGYPGLSAYNCIMPGITSIVARGFIDEKRIAAQGHSWGGYQVAYLATRTDLFAAIESGAPVVNMHSAYGGIRWATGLNRSMQYEHQQSRIGGTIWERPIQYIENSPLFYMDKVKTPILIMANDQDGHVPWWQGIEYFVSLKRMNKPTWLLNYTGEPHWPTIYSNKVDFQKRMFGFFEHYLNGKPMPKWMSEGVKAVDRDFDLNY